MEAQLEQTIAPKQRQIQSHVQRKVSQMMEDLGSMDIFPFLGHRRVMMISLHGMEAANTYITRPKQLEKGSNIISHTSIFILGIPSTIPHGSKPERARQH